MPEHKIIFDKNAQPDPNAEPRYHKSVPIGILLRDLPDIKDLDNDDPDALSELDESREEPDYSLPPQDQPKPKSPANLSKSPVQKSRSLGKSEEPPSSENPLFNSTVMSIAPSESEKLKNNDPRPYRCNQIVPSTGRSTVIERNTKSPLTPMMLDEINAIIKEESLIIPK
jgi:hypothetical protein